MFKLLHFFLDTSDFIFHQVKKCLKQRATSKIGGKKGKTYNNEDSPVVTHLSTNSSLPSLGFAERTGCAILSGHWSYVLVMPTTIEYRDWI